MNSDWYLDDDFWRTFGPLMFNADTFARAEEEVQQLLELLELPDPLSGKVLDLGCGPGRHALPLAAAGLEVTAVDTSATLLDQLRAAEGGQSIEIIEADMREFRREGHYDLALVMWTSFGYFEDESDHERVLENLRHSLAPGGRLVLDLVGLEYLCRSLEPVHLTEYEDGRLLIERPLLVDDMTRLENEWLLVDGERVDRRVFSHRVWSAGEAHALLRHNGFTVRGLYGDLAGSSYDLESERLVIIAELSDN